MKNERTKLPRKVINVKKGACPTDEPMVTRYVPQLKNVHAILLFFAIFSIWLVYGLIQGFPSLWFISYFGFSIVLTNLFKDNTTLNSLVAPFTFLSTATSIVDIIGMNGVLFIHLIPAIISIFIVNVRRNYNLAIMMASSFVYTIWMYMTFEYTMNFADPVYDRIPPPFDDSLILGFWIGFGMFVTTFCIWLLRSQCRSSLFPWAKKTAW